MKKILYIDMNNTLVDFQSGIDRVDPEMNGKYKDKDVYIYSEESVCKLLWSLKTFEIMDYF